jgi:tRNA threonylcarbamoyladenosine biosynthesis protein TsaE
MVTNISHSPADTLALGEAWGQAVEPGTLIGLQGDLGAGKTQLVKGLARGLRIAARVVSPTFALINVYSDGRLPLAHLDLYRLETTQQIRAAGLEEYLSPQGVTVIEWAERWFGGRPDKLAAKGLRLLRWVEIAPVSESERRICYEDFSA